METEKLAQFIVDEVYKKLMTAYEEPHTSLNQSAVILWDKDLQKYSVLKKQYNIIQYEDNIREYEVLIIAKLCLRGLSNLALGTNVSVEERFILKTLLKGKRVYLLEDGLEYRKYKTTAPKTLYNKYMAYEDTLKAYGIEIIKTPDCVLYENNYSSCSKEIVNKNSLVGHLLNKKAVTEIDIRRLIEKGTTRIEVSKNTIITPLAEDFIRAHHIEVIRS